MAGTTRRTTRGTPSSWRRAWTVAVAAVLLAAATLSATPAEAEGGRRSPTIVRTRAGLVEGTQRDGYRTFEGIPFAAPPVGDLRFAPPHPVEPWDGVRDATVPGSACPQIGTSGVSLDEDCLYLNVTTPDRRGRSGRFGRRLPVMVWIHGGAFLTGDGASYDASRLAVDGDVVVVTVNYRLGPFGYLAHPDLSAEDPTAGSGNYALADNQAALEWVRRNIAAFGGDPRRVTIFGESAGGAMACANLAAPDSRWRFRRAIAQSYSCAGPFVDLATAEAGGAGVADAVGCGDAADVTACLRSVDVETLLGSWYGGGPVVGGGILPIQPLAAIESGATGRIDLMHGNTQDENRLFVPLGDPTLLGLTPEGYEAELAAVFGPLTPAVLERYPVGAYESPIIALSTVFTDWGNVLATCGHLDAYDAARDQRRIRIYAYQFRDRTADPLVDFPGFDEGAQHAVELPYLFPGLFGDGLNAEQEALADAMVAYWTSFARNGRPRGPDLPRWRTYRGDGRVLGLAPESLGGIHPVDVATESNCAFWESLLGDGSSSGLPAPAVPPPGGTGAAEPAAIAEPEAVTALP